MLSFVLKGIAMIGSFLNTHVNTLYSFNSLRNHHLHLLSFLNTIKRKSGRMENRILLLVLLPSILFYFFIATFCLASTPINLQRKLVISTVFNFKVFQNVRDCKISTKICKFHQFTFCTLAKNL